MIIHKLSLPLKGWVIAATSGTNMNELATIVLSEDDVKDLFNAICDEKQKEIVKITDNLINMFASANEHIIKIEEELLEKGAKTWD